MKTLIKASFAITFAGAAFAVPLQAQDASQEGEGILVQRPVEQMAYVAHLAEQLDRELSRVHFHSRMGRSGIVKVRFVANGEGVAEAVTLYAGSGNHQFDRAALRAVNRLDNIGQAGFGGAEEQIVQANIIFAVSEYEAQWLQRRLEREESARLASRTADEPNVLALTFSPVPRS